MAIYLDVIWFLNFCIDLLLLLLTGLVLKRNIIKLRISLAALLASSSVFLVITSLSTMYYHPLFKVIFSGLIVIIAFGFKKFSFFIQNLVSFYFVSFVCGGGLIALHYFFNSEMIVLNGVMTTKTTGFGSPISWLLIIFGFPAIWLFTRHNISQIELRKLKYEEIVQVELFILDQHISMKGLIDSGNQLQDPLTKKPVMIIDMNTLHDKFPKSIVDQAKHPENIGDPRYEIDPQWENKLCVVPYRGIGQKNHFIIGLKPEKVLIFLGTGEAIDCRNVIIGLNFTTLCSSGDFHCILHPHMLLHGKKLLA